MKIVNWTTLKSFLDSKNVNAQYVEFPEEYMVLGIDGPFTIQCNLDKNATDTTDLDDFEANYKVNGNRRVEAKIPFADKKHSNGKKLFRRVHGLSLSLDNSGTQQSVTYTIPYTSCLMTAAEVINSVSGDTLNFKILDTAAGTITGVPNQQINQFGFDVNIPAEFYNSKSEYDSELFAGLQIKIEYTPIDSVERSVYFNLVLHELV